MSGLPFQDGGLTWKLASAACRMLLVIGLVAFARMDRPNPVRFVGALGTYVTGLGLGGAVFVG